MTNLPRRFLGKLSALAAPHIPLGVYRRMMPRNPVGFFYHAISERPLPHLKHLYPSKIPAEFEADLRYLKTHFTLVGYPELLAHFEGRATLPPDAAFVSFDDGFAECATVAAPLLRKHGVPGMFFLATGWLDNQAMYYRGKISLCLEAYESLTPAGQGAALAKLAPALPPEARELAAFPAWLKARQQTAEPVIDRVCAALEVDVAGYLRRAQPFLTGEQARGLMEDGFTLGAHTRTHPKLGLVDESRQAEEIVESCREVAARTGEAQVPFAFPFSGNGVRRAFLEGLRGRHPVIGLLFDTQKLTRDRPFIFHRIWADQPVPGVPAGENLAYWLHQAYQGAPPLFRRMGPGKRLPVGEKGA